MTEQRCRECDCTNDRACYREAGFLDEPHLVLDDGTPLVTCEWAEPDLCSACAEGDVDASLVPPWIHPNEQAVQA